MELTLPYKVPAVVDLLQTNRFVFRLKIAAADSSSSSNSPGDASRGFLIFKNTVSRKAYWDKTDDKMDITLDKCDANFGKSPLLGA